MKRLGKVVSVEKNKAKVILRKHSACGDCGACHLGEENMEMQIDAINTINAKEGDIVEIDMETQNVLTAAFLAYGIPLIALLFGILTSSKIFNIIKFSYGNKEIYSLIFGILLMGLSYLFINLNEKKIKNNGRYISKITNIIE